MKVRTKEVYNCEYCNKLYLIRNAAEKHELACFKNPANRRPCFECENLSKENIEVETGRYDYDGNEVSRNVDLFCCKKKDGFLFTPKNEIKGNQFELYDTSNEPMPRKCGLFKSIYDMSCGDILNKQ